MKNSGFTLIEILIYLGLFSIIIGGGMVAVYQIIESTNATNAKVIIQDDANFVLRKLEWSLNGASSVTASPTSLTVTNYGTTMTFNLSSDNLNLEGLPLNSSFVNIAAVPGTDMFSYDSTEKKVSIVFTINGQRFDQTKYLR